MITITQSKFQKFMGEDLLPLTNAFIYIVSNSLELDERDGEVIAGSESLASLVPSKELLDGLSSGNISKKEFKRKYRKQLESYECRFIIYTIIRSLNENNYMPIFLCSDNEIGYLEIFAKYMKKKFGLSAADPKKYRKSVKQLWKDSKKVSKKKNKRSKAFEKKLRSFIKDNVQLSIDGLEELEKMDKQFAIDRVAILVNYSENAIDDVKKKSVIKAIDDYSKYKKSAAKRVKSAVKELGLSKRTDRWSKKDAITLALTIYSDIHGTSEANDNNK